jgi:SAM-dependent methyltransferase
MPCCSCQEIENQFGSDTAKRDLRRFQRRGPIRSTRVLIDDLLKVGVAGASVLDIGGGIGAIHHALLNAGASAAIHVDLSPDYITVAREESARRGHAARVRFVHGDFVAVATDVPDADIVTLDRVICCYPEMDLPVGRRRRESTAAGGHGISARRVVGAPGRDARQHRPPTSTHGVPRVRLSPRRHRPRVSPTRLRAASMPPDVPVGCGHICEARGSCIVEVAVTAGGIQSSGRRPASGSTAHEAGLPPGITIP